MTEQEYENLCEDYKKDGYVPIGTKEQPYFIPKPTEKMKEYFTEVFKATFKGNERTDIN